MIIINVIFVKRLTNIEFDEIFEQSDKECVIILIINEVLEQ